MAGFFSRLKEGLTKTRNNIVSSIDAVFGGFSTIDEDFYEELEEILIMGDIGVNATEKILERLRAHGSPYAYQHLSYDYGSHLFVPMELPSAKLFRSERGKNKEPARKARMDSLEKTLAFVSQW